MERFSHYDIQFAIELKGEGVEDDKLNKTIGHKAICEFPHVTANEFVIKLNKPGENVTDIKFYNTK